MWVYLKRYRTLLFHSLYGVPCVLVAILDGFKLIDLSPFFQPPVPAMIGSGIAIGSLVIHSLADAHLGSVRDDGTAGVNVTLSPPVVNPVPPGAIVNTEIK